MNPTLTDFVPRSANGGANRYGIKTVVTDTNPSAYPNHPDHADPKFNPNTDTKMKYLLLMSCKDGPGSGVWFDLGPHLIDQALQLFGKVCSIA